MSTARSLTVKNVSTPRPWSTKDGNEFVSYDLILEGVDKTVEINQKPQTPAPQEGASLLLELSDHPRFGDKLKGKKVNPGGYGGGGGRAPRDPAERRSIQIQHAQKCAVDVVRLAVDLGEWKPPDDEKTTDIVLKVARKLFDQIEELSGA